MTTIAEVRMRLASRGTLVGSIAVPPVLYAAIQLPALLAAFFVLIAIGLLAYVELRWIRSTATVTIRIEGIEIETSGDVDPRRAAQALQSIKGETSGAADPDP